LSYRVYKVYSANATLFEPRKSAMMERTSRPALVAL
jgi:hypothetical protein